MASATVRSVFMITPPWPSIARNCDEIITLSVETDTGTDRGCSGELDSMLLLTGINAAAKRQRKLQALPAACGQIANAELELMHVHTMRCRFPAP
jgi:hypothetical protein